MAGLPPDEELHQSGRVDNGTLPAWNRAPAAAGRVIRPFSLHASSQVLDQNRAGGSGPGAMGKTLTGVTRN